MFDKPTVDWTESEWSEFLFGEEEYNQALLNVDEEEEEEYDGELDQGGDASSTAAVCDACCSVCDCTGGVEETEEEVEEVQTVEDEVLCEACAQKELAEEKCSSCGGAV